MNSAAFDVLIKILESYQTQIPISGIKARFYSSRAFQRAQKCPKRTRNEEDTKVLKFQKLSSYFGGGTAMVARIQRAMIQTQVSSYGPSPQPAGLQVILE